MTEFKCVNCEENFPKDQLNDLHDTYGICDDCYEKGQRWKYAFSVKNAIENCKFEHIDSNIEYSKEQIKYHLKHLDDLPHKYNEYNPKKYHKNAIKRHKDLIKVYKKEKAKRLKKND